jgi:ankyrin repeat protein
MRAFLAATMAALLFAVPVAAQQEKCAALCSAYFWQNADDQTKSAKLSAYLDSGGDPDFKFSERDVALLHYAALWGTTEHIKILVDAWAYVDIKSNSESTPLHGAVWGKSPANIAALTAAGADPNVQNEKGASPLHEVAELYCTSACTIALLNGGADPDLRDDYGNTALHYAASNKEDHITYLLKAGADPNLLDNDNETPIFSAVRWGSPDRIHALLEAGSYFHLRNNDGETPLYTAARIGTAAKIAILLAAGADPNLKNTDGTTPLDGALLNDRLEGTDAVENLRAAMARAD